MPISEFSGQTNLRELIQTNTQLIDFSSHQVTLNKSPSCFLPPAFNQNSSLPTKFYGINNSQNVFPWATFWMSILAKPHKLQSKGWIPGEDR